MTTRIGVVFLGLCLGTLGGLVVPEDCSSVGLGGGGISLTCSLSAINSEFEKTNFSVIPSQETLSLVVQCTEGDLHSRLTSGGFIALNKLLHLEIRGCNLKGIPDEAFAGLSKLRVLKIRSASRLSIQNDEAFAGLTDLQTLDLAHNSITSLSRKSFCNLSKLRLLNLSRNAIESSVNIGECLNGLSDLRTLDLSFNRIWYLMLNNPALKVLLANNNAIATLEEDSLKNVPALRKIDLSNNVIENLPSSFVSNRLEELILSNNSITHVSQGTFNNQSSLLSLDLSGNRLQSSIVFSSPSLQSLDLSSNELESMNPAVFLELSSLITLNLNNNRLHVLPTLRSSGNTLTNLYVSSNSLGPVPGDLLNGLESLSHLTLDHNGIESLPSTFFLNSSGVSVLDLSHNHLVEIPSAVRSLHNLQSFSVGHNRIRELGMLSMEQLWRLQADHNHIQKIGVSNFKDLKSLQVLDLSSNRIEDLESESFTINSQLKAIRLDNNRIISVGDIFQELRQLNWLNLSSNSLSAFDYKSVPRTIQWLDLHDNLLRSLDNDFSLENDFPLLGHLDASFNMLSEIGPQSVPDHVVTLLLNDNHIATMVPYTFFKKKDLKKVDLSLNRMESISSNALRLSDGGGDGIQFFFGGNPIKCDCQMTWFKGINSASSLQNFPRVADLESIYCELIYSRETSFVPLVEALGENFLCEYETHCFALCQCCEYDACDCEMACPSNCTCFHDVSWVRNIVECSFSGLRILPDRLPMDATEIFLDGNEIPDVGSHAFIGRKNLRSLFLNDSHVTILPNNSFNGLSALEELHLENNEIQRLEGSEFSGLVRLRQLFIHNNRLSHVSDASFAGLQALETLTLSGNRLSLFTPWSLRGNPMLRSLSLGDNPWTCDCAFMRRFADWLEGGFQGKLGDDPSCARGTLIEGNSCPPHSKEERRQVAVPQKDDDLLLPLVISLALVLALLLSLLVLVAVYRLEIRVWVFSRFGVRLCDSFREDTEKNKLYDAFFAYSSKDDVFVREVLAPELEHGSEYKIVLLYRDLPCNPSYVADTIVQASEEARRTILVLSEHFLKSEWSRYNYKSGLHQALGGTFKNSHHLIVIILGAVSLKDLDPDIRHYFGSCLILRWGDKLFWDKLKYSLPDVEEGRQAAASASAINLTDVRPSSSSHYSFSNDSCQRSLDSSIRTMTIHI